MTLHQWLVLTYRLPTEPSRLRVGIWRELKRIGACYLQQTTCVLPNRPDLRERLIELVKRVETMGGEAVLFDACTQDYAADEKVVTAFNSLRNSDYFEVAEQCEHLLREIDFETERGNLTSSELEEVEEDLERLKRWFARISDRDWFAAGERECAESLLATCETRFEQFAALVYQHESLSREDDGDT